MTTKQIQNLLQYLNYYTLLVDGDMGPVTRESIELFQRVEGLVVDGIPGVNTQAALIDAVANGRFNISKNTTTGKETDHIQETHSGWENIRHFTRDEFRCPCGKCGGFPVEPDMGLVATMDQMREDFGTAVVVVPPDGHSGGSGVRCKSYNATLSGSVSNSRHLLGKAADFSSPGQNPPTVEAYLQKLKQQGKIRYWYKILPGNWHMDVE